MSFWSHGHSYGRIAFKIKVVVYVPHSYSRGLDTLYPDPGVQEAQKGAWWGSGASAMHIGGHFIKQKLQGPLNLVGVGHLLDPKSILEGPEPGVFLELWSQTFKGSL